MIGGAARPTHGHVVPALLAATLSLVPGLGLAARHRLGPAQAWRHCVVAGESRPATTCPVPTLVRAHKGRRIPGDGGLQVRLPSPSTVSGPLALEVEAQTYAAAPALPQLRAAMRDLDALLRRADQPHGLAKLLAFGDAFRPVTQATTLVTAALPDRLPVRLPAERAGERAAYAVWAWPIENADVEVPLPAVGAGTRLTLALGIHDVGVLLGMEPVRFHARLVDAAGAAVASLWTRTVDPAATPAERGWHERIVDLSPWAGRTLRLVLSTESTGAAPPMHFGTWARPLLDLPAADDDGRRSVLLLSIDTLRADHVGAYGAPRPTTPRLDALAAGAFLFTRAYAPFPSTTASHMSMLTSLLPCAHRVTVPEATLATGVPTVTEILAQAGFTTAGITEDALIAGASGFDRGFDRYWDQMPDAEVGTFADGIALTRAWLDDNGDRPFFVFLHTYQVHEPYKIPDHLAGLFPVADDAPEAVRLAADYDMGLRHADALLGRLLDDLARRGLLGRIAVVVTSDHGTEFGERGGIGHARGVHVEQLHVPLVVHAPWLGGGRRIEHLVQVIDLPRTVLALAGVEAPATLRGRSLVPLLEGGTVAPADVFGEQLWGTRQTALRTDAHTWLLDEQGIRLYDPRTDPLEQHDRQADDPALATRGRQTIERFRAECEREHGAVSSTGVRIDPDRAEALRRLGYVE